MVDHDVVTQPDKKASLVRFRIPELSPRATVYAPSRRHILTTLSFTAP